MNCATASPRPGAFVAGNLGERGSGAADADEERAGDGAGDADHTQRMDPVARAERGEHDDEESRRGTPGCTACGPTC